MSKRSARFLRTPRAAVLLGLLGLVIVFVLVGRMGLWGLRPGWRPHVIVYLIDTLRADHLGSYGYERETSPTIDALARDGVLFRRAYAQASWTKPSVGSLFTGLMPSLHGAIRREHRLRSDVPTLAEVLRKHGYATAAFVSNPNVLPVYGFDRGFDAVYDVESIALSARAEDVHEAVFHHLDSGPPAPLFLYVHTRDPHAPYEAPPPFDKRFAPLTRRPSNEAERLIDLYDGEIFYADHEFARFLARLEDEGIYDDAVIVVLSDHGEEFFEHGHKAHGRTLYQEQLHVPLILRLPDGARGLVVDQPVRIMDLMPTLCELLDMECPGGLAGRSFLSLFSEDAGAATYAPPLYSELDLDANALTSLIQGRYKLIRRWMPQGARGDQLFDLSDDPAELHDLAPERADVVAALEMRLTQIESSLAGGSYIEFTNGFALDDVHTYEGTLEALAGEFESVASQQLASGNELVLSPDRRRLRFRVTLENRPNPIQQTPAVIVAVARIRFALKGEPAIRLTLDLDGETLARDRLVLGLAEPSESDLPLAASLDDPRLRIESRSQLREESVGADRAPFARLYTLPEVESATATVDETIEERLRALGYLDAR